MINKIEQIKELKMLLENGAINQDQYSILLNETIGNNFNVEEKKENKMALSSENDHKSVIISDQEWMSENLNVKTFKNGEPIPEAATQKEWERAMELSQPAWCYYDNDPDNASSYGLLYNFYALYDNRGLAPEGWQIPTRKNFEELIENCGGPKNAGRELKSKDQWNFEEYGVISEETEYSSKEMGFKLLPAEKATNKSGFNVKPGGCIFDVKNYNYDEEYLYAKLGFGTLIWTPTISDYDYEYLLHPVAFYGKNNVDFMKMEGFSHFAYVRCIKKNEKAAESNFLKLKEKILNFGQDIINTFKIAKYDICNITASHDNKAIYYEITSAAGYRISTMKSIREYFIYQLSLKLQLSISDIQCITPLPGKGTIGIVISFNSETETLEEINIEIEKKLDISVKKETFHEKKHITPYFLPEVIQFDFSRRDILFKEAAEIVVSTQQGSGSLLQRKLKIGYNRAAKLIDELEAAGILGPYEGSNVRSLNIQELEHLKLFYKKNESEVLAKGITEESELPLANVSLSRKIFNLFLGKEGR